MFVCPGHPIRRVIGLSLSMFFHSMHPSVDMSHRATGNLAHARASPRIGWTHASGGGSLLGRRTMLIYLADSSGHAFAGRHCIVASREEK